jgi:hypothetical protein
VKATRAFLSAIPVVAALCFLGASVASPRLGQDAAQKPAEKAPDKAQDKTSQKAQEKSAPKPTPKLPAEIELLETSVRFEADGSSRKEVHAHVKINDELGVRQFARLNFDFNRTFEQVEIPLVRITHPSGGIADVLPSAIVDNPNPAVVNFPAYQDVRVKSVRILGLEPGDFLECRVVTTVSHHALAPNFWLEHTFDRTGVVSHEIFELDLPVVPNLRVQINPATPPDRLPHAENRGRAIYHWTWKYSAEAGTNSDKNASSPDVALSTFSSWNQLADRLSSLLIPSDPEFHVFYDKAASLVSMNSSSAEKMAAIYDFVSQKIRTVDLPLGASGFRPRKPADIIATGYGTPEDKFALFAALANNFFGPARAGFVSDSNGANVEEPPSPARFDHLLTMSGYPSVTFWMDLNIEVAPFLMVPPEFRGKQVFVVGPAVEDRWERVLTAVPFPSSQGVKIDASLTVDGKLTSKVRYSMRGENELLLRVAFHQTPRDKWDGVAQLLALSDGFRGQVSKTAVSDPYATHEPFTVRYEISQLKFVDWVKKPVRVPAILPLLGLPDPPAKTAPGSDPLPIELGTPLDVEVSAVLHLPAGTTAHIPTGTSVERDFATYSSKYSAKDGTLTATRHLNFILRQIPADRAADYNAFLRTVQNDESQVFTLERADTTPPAGSKPQKP